MNFSILCCLDSAGGGGIPFAIQNLLPVIFNMKVKNYFFSQHYWDYFHLFLFSVQLDLELKTLFKQILIQLFSQC